MKAAFDWMIRHAIIIANRQSEVSTDACGTAGRSGRNLVRLRAARVLERGASYPEA
jgi:hypothetical protein